ncbi:hypothetical protein AAC387_Pa03g2414 [Persea americana]
MVFQKKLDYGFNGYQVPAVPRGSRSVRRRRLFKKDGDDSQMCAFDLLATLAGELLLEKERSPASCNVSSGRTEFAIRKDSIKQEQQDEEHSFKQEPCDQGSCDESASVFMLGSHSQSHDPSSMDYSHAKEDSTSRLASVIMKSEKPKNTSYAEELVVDEDGKEYQNYPHTIHETRHVEGSSPGNAESHDGKVEDEIERQLEVEQRKTKSLKHGTVSDIIHWDDPMEMDTKPPALVSSDSSAELPMYGAQNPCSSFSRCRDDVKVVSKDDDENSSGCTQRSTSTLKSFQLPCLGDRRIRKLMASKYRKSASTITKDGELSNSELDMKPVFRSRKICYTRQRSQRCSFKRRKLFERSKISISDGVINSEVVSDSFEKGISGEETGLGATMHQGSRVSSPVIGHKSSMQSRDSHVKLRIKSFKVPELFIEIPETATVGSLKRSVMDAVTAVFGGALRVGVLLHGKKIRDDNITLLQTGISCDDKVENLGFTLEPATVHPPLSQLSEDPQCLLPCDSTQPVTRNPLVPASDPGVSEAFPDSPVTNSGNSTESNHDSVSFPADTSPEKSTPDSKALVSIPATSLEALAMVPLHRKSKRSEVVQRRIRRPFSVSEVEALVQAVERLGTGRWRDVKLRAFENAKHRTYVDLKDKWKTLVHTARISPQQRRGEPVPQELLDRVLAAHAYWSQHQNKHHNSKLMLQQQSEPPCLLH